MTMANDPLLAGFGLEIAMLAEKSCDLGLDGLGKQFASTVAQDFCERVVKGSWLNQFGHVLEK